MRSSEMAEDDRHSTTDGRIAVLAVHTATLPPLGADTWVHAQILRHLDRRTHEVHVACVTGARGSPTPTYRALSEIPELDVIPVDFGPELFRRSGLAKLTGALRSLAVVPSVVRLAVVARRRGVRVIHTSDRPRDALISVMLGRLTGADSLVHVHVIFGSWMGRALRWSLANADGLVAVSDFVARSLVAAGLPADRVHTVLNAIDPTEWHPGRGRVDARAELGIADGAPVVLSVSRLFPEKGGEELVRAFAHVHRRAPDAELLVVGNDLSEHGEFSAGLRRLAEELGVGEAVRFLGRRDDVPRLMAAADVYAMPSFEEPFGLVFLEAMAMRLPVVALANGGTLEVVEHGRTGLLSAPGDVDTLAEHITLLIRDSELRDRMGDAGRARVEERFTTRRQARHVAALYATLLSPSVSDPDGDASDTPDDER